MLLYTLIRVVTFANTFQCVYFAALGHNRHCMPSSFKFLPNKILSKGLKRSLYWQKIEKMEYVMAIVSEASKNGCIRAKNVTVISIVVGTEL